MATDFKLPELGENIKTIQVVKVLVAVGDTVAVDQPVLEVETDKATVEVPATVAGQVAAVHVKPGDEIGVGHLIFSVAGTPAAAAPAAPAAARDAASVPLVPAVAAPAIQTPAAPPAPPPAVKAPAKALHGEFVVPELGENIKSIQVARVFVKRGQLLAKDQPVLELETDKATVEVPSTVSGVVQDVLVNEGDTLRVGAIVFRYVGEAYAPEEEPAHAAGKAAPATPTPPVKPAAVPAAVAALSPLPPGKRVPAAPSVRRFARELGVDITRVPGTVGHGRVSTEDVKRYAKAIITSQQQAPAAGSGGLPAAGMALPPLPDFGKWGGIQREKMSGIRRATAAHMALSWSQIPHVTIFDTADITDLEDLRARYADRAVAAGGKLTMAVMVIKVAAQALKVFPKFNASIDMAAREIVLKQYCNIGVAVDTERGLMVPAIRDADKKNMIQIAAELAQVAEKARTGKISLAELEGSTFTITNLGRTCGVYFTPIINYPEVAILGVGRAFEEVDPRSGKGRRKLPLSLSFDHRIIDGSDGVKFLGWIIEALGEPLVLSLEG